MKVQRELGPGDIPSWRRDLRPVKPPRPGEECRAGGRSSLEVATQQKVYDGGLIATRMLMTSVKQAESVRRLVYNSSFAAVGHPCLRLIRHTVGPYVLGDLQPGSWRDA